MSTKTTFKRIALVAVASLGFGMLSIVPSQAATELFDITTAETVVSGGESASHVAGAANYVTIAGSASVSAVSGTSYSLTVSGAGATFSTAGTGLVISTTDATKASVADSVSLTAGTPTVRVMTPTAGTVTVTVSKNVDASGITTTTVEDTLTITVNAAPTGTVYVQSTAFLNTTTGSAATADTATPSASGTLSSTEVARITVRQYASSDTATAMTDAASKAVVVTVAGAGAVSTVDTGLLTGPTATVAAGTNDVNDFYLYADGRTGTSTITISVNGAVVATKTFTFFGALASYSVVASKTHIGVGETGTLTISGKDALGNAAVLGTVNATSGTTTVATVTATDTSGVITVTGVASGSAVITLANSSTTPTVSTTVTVNVAKITAKSVALSFDKAEYNPGEKMTVTVTALDSNGAGVADGSRNLFSSAGITSNVALQGATWTAAAAVTVVAGKATFTAYAPLVSGPIVVSATEGAALDAVIAGGTAAVVTASAVVLSDGVAQAAADAAAEATDAANAATDAANAAAEAADAATAAAQDAADAVAALSTQVSEMINALKKQITALTNLVIKIQKKVKA
jgi:hypothetical protein